MPTSPTIKRPPLVALPEGKITPIPEALSIGVQHHQAGRLRKAEAVYKAILAIDPGHADASHLCGLIAHQRGAHQEAIRLISNAISINKGAALFYNNRGEAHRALGLLDEAIADYRMAVSLQPRLAQAWHNQGLAHLVKGERDPAAACFGTVLAIDPNHAEAHYSLGNVLVMAGRHEKAITEYRKVLTIRPNSPWAYNNIGTALRRTKKFNEAVEFHKKAVELAPNSVELLTHFANALKEAERDAEAITVLSRILELDPKHETAMHLLNALRGIDTDRPSAAYISHVFDAYAANFDHHLTEKLQCRIPVLLREMLTRHLAEQENKPGDVLDLGCGTGLMGMELKSLASRLVGVDLSPQMIAQAATRALYDELIVEDLCEFLARAPSDAFDLVSAADVLNYLGNLTPVLAGAHRLLRPGGLVLFSVEHLFEAGKDFKLGKTGRYMHAAPYIRRLALATGFAVLSIESAELRKEKGQAVEGLLFLLKKVRPSDSGLSSSA